MNNRRMKKVESNSNQQEMLESYHHKKHKVQCNHATNVLLVCHNSPNSLKEPSSVGIVPVRLLKLKSRETANKQQENEGRWNQTAINMKC